MCSIVYNQHEVLHIIKPQKDTRRRVMRYSPKGADDTHRTLCGDDMPSRRLNKKERSDCFVLFGGGERCRKKVDNMADFLKKLPRKEVEVQGLAFSVVVIGRLELKRLAKMNEA